MAQIEIVFPSIANSSQTDPHLLDYQIWFLFFSVFTKSNLYHPITLEYMVRPDVELAPNVAAGVVVAYSEPPSFSSYQFSIVPC